MLVAILMFIAMFALDFVWAWYTRAVALKSRYQAAAASGAIYLIGGIATVEYVQNPWLLIPATLGGMLGTYAAMTVLK